MRALLITLLLSLCVFGEEFRTWTNTDNQETDAAMVELKGDSVILRLRNGRTTPYPLSKLTKADQDYAKSFKAEPGEPEGPTKLNFNDPWPEVIKFQGDAGIKIVEENSDKNSYIYESTNYRFICDARLSKSVVNSFSDLFEATFLFTRTLPLAIDGGKSGDEKLPILLFEKFENYVKAGGPPQSAGVYIGSKGQVMVPLKSLGVENTGRRYIVDRDKTSKTLPHELLHQLTPPAYYRSASMGWFTEGLAEYVAVTSYKSGTFRVKNNVDEIIAYVTGYGENNKGGRALGNEIKLPPIKQFMLQDYQSFLKNANVNYGSGLLITYYFFHMDGDGDAKRIKEFLKALRKGKQREEALAVLLDGRSFDELEEEITEAWSKKRIDLIFGS